MKINFARTPVPLGHAPIRDALPMYRESSIISDEQRQIFLEIIHKQIILFLKHMDIDLEIRYREEVLKRPAVLANFAKFLTDNRVFTCTMYYWEKPSSDHGNGPSYIALGLDIEEDELYTLQSLKTKGATNA